MSRMQIRQRYPNLTEEKEDTVLGQYPGHEKFQCEGTKALSCLSRVVKQKSDDEGEDKVMSLEQFLEMGVENGEENGYTFVCSFSDDELLTACEKLQDRALAPENWYDRLSKFIKSEPRPSLEDLQKFADEGDSIFYDLKPLVPLKGILRRSQEWIEQINGLLSGSGYWPLNRFKRIISSVSEMDIMIPESQRVIEHANKVKNYTKRVFQLLKQTTIDSSQVKQLLEESKTIHVDLQEIDLLSRLRARFDWLERAKAVLSNSKSVFMDELDKIIMEGRQSGLERDDSVIQQLSYRRLLAEQLEAKIKSMVTTDRVAPATLDKFLEDMKGLPVSRKLYENIRDNRSECQRLEGELINLSETSKRENVMLRPGFNHAKQVLEASRVCVTKPDVVWLDKGIQLVEDWFRRGKKLFGKGHAQVHVLRNQVLIAERRNESAFSLDDRRGGPRKCICREEGETNFDVRCQRCLETYHGKCLKLNRHNTDILHFTCPICDWRLNIPRDGLRPKLKELDEWVKQAKTLPFCPEEFPVLEHMVKQGKEFKKYIRSHIDLNAPSTLPVGDLKFYLCKLTGGELLFLEEINYLRSEIHRLDHVASDPPPPILDISLPATKRATPQPQLPQPPSQQFQPQTEQHHQQNHHNPYPQYQQTQQHNVSQQQQQQQPSQLSSRNTLSSSPGLLPPPFVSTPTLPQSPRPYSATPPPLPQLSSYKLPQPSQLPFQKRSNTDSPHPPADDPK
ncbi:hypothetical protein TRICI_004166 [Trichomonascus ciferrii]|uniref:Lysine-specific demethylase-like domain-containing protein n=1 Tax=Trichomonascus ciferrii TaxID=44093 RepID=A0A642V1Q6_9ASCO|nr:hypothetical protein TRICI_004166 [Trichomonascus ciferrii]